MPEDSKSLDGSASEGDLRVLDDRHALLHAIIETSPDGLITIDESGHILSFNPAAEAMFGYAANEVIGRNIKCLMGSPHREAHDGYLRRYMTTGEKRIIGIGRQVFARKKNGEMFPIDLAVGEVQQASRRIFAGFIRDDSARLAAEQNANQLRGELLHVSRLSEMGEMASALAHELNQPLTAIINYLEACRRLSERSGEASEDQTASLMQKAADQAHRAGRIIQQLRKFVAKGETERILEPINAVVQEAAQLALVGTHQHDIEPAFDLADGLPELLIDRVQIQQVIMNLVRNAVEAMAAMEKRELTVRSGAVAPSSVQIDIIDTGPGLPDAVAERLFQPFVTTKPGGLGIGLSICRTIIDAHGGEISAHANPDGGTIFRLKLRADQDDHD